MWDSDLEHEVKKSRFDENDQDALHWAPPSLQTEILHDNLSMAPGIILHDEQLNQVDRTAQRIIP